MDYILKTTVYLADMNDYAAMNEVYASMLPDPKPGRTAVQVGKLPGNFLVEIEASKFSPYSLTGLLLDTNMASCCYS